MRKSDVNTVVNMFKVDVIGGFNNCMQNRKNKTGYQQTWNNLIIYIQPKEVRGIIGTELGEISKDVAILDVGCGIGNTMYNLYANGYTKLYGFDIEKELFKVVKGG